MCNSVWMSPSNSAKSEEGHLRIAEAIVFGTMKKDSLFESAWQGSFNLKEKFFRVESVASANFHILTSCERERAEDKNEKKTHYFCFRKTLINPTSANPAAMIALL